MIVFSNTTPFIALASINQLDLLPQLFTEVCVVPEVIEECRAGGPVLVPKLTSLSWIRIVPSSPEISTHLLKSALIFSLNSIREKSIPSIQHLSIKPTW
ncbi:MAG: hypothetical protein D3910_17225 [Candidatus Electrothrix sp. ATG2]|nr:hypothetical protein [Candidatus Electrothrix sp. ATG2]